MRTFRSEFLNKYESYTFSFTEYAIREKDSDIPEIYDNGYLPYTGNLNIDFPIFYLARSLRVNLSKFNDSSENRRVNRKLNSIAPQIKRISLKDFDTDNSEFIHFCMSYANERFSGNAMTEIRFKYILNSGIATDIFEFRDSKDSSLLGYVLAIVNNNTFHYWFSFYNTKYTEVLPLGKWMMWKMISWSKEAGLQYIYLGTAYGTKSLYKIRDFKGLEFYNGNYWDNNMNIIKALCKTDSEVKEKDYFKTLDNPNLYISDIIKNIKHGR